MDVGAYFAALAFLIPFIILGTNWVMEYTGLKSKQRKREEAYNGFEKVVESLASDNSASQLSAAVLLRRYFSLKIGKSYFLRQETIGVISSILRTLPTGIYQKTLADGLAYAHDLSNADLQRTNLQNIYLGSKSETLNMRSTDFFMANLAYGLIDNVDARNVVLYNSILYSTIIKNSDFSNANFSGADMTNVKFVKVKLEGANFARAINIPKEIADNLHDNIYTSDSFVTTHSRPSEKTVFFSMPGNMAKSDEVMIEAYKRYLIRNGFEVLYYTKDTYPRFGQLSQVKSAIEKCCALVAFGTKQSFIKEGVYRPGMTGEKPINETWISTPWNEVEVGMAVMAGISILLIKDKAIEDGIFDEMISESFVFCLDSGIDVKELEHNRVFNAWLSRIN